jgi:hypothetical protein
VAIVNPALAVIRPAAVIVPKTVSGEVVPVLPTLNVLPLLNVRSVVVTFCSDVDPLEIVNPFVPVINPLIVAVDVVLPVPTTKDCPVAIVNPALAVIAPLAVIVLQIIVVVVKSCSDVEPALIVKPLLPVIPPLAVKVVHPKVVTVVPVAVNPCSEVVPELTVNPPAVTVNPLARVNVFTVIPFVHVNVLHSIPP